jgi:FG-GAP-like repeat
MNKSRFRRAGLPAVAVVAATAAVATAVWLGGNANAGTTNDAALTAAAAAQARSAQAKTADGAKSFRKNLKANGISATLATDELNFGDLTGDGIADLGAVDKSGVLWIYPGSGYSYPGTGTRSKRLFNTRFRVGGGWNAFTTIVRHGDFNGDGKQDVVARNAAGQLYFYAGTGTTPAVFKKGLVVGRGGWQVFLSIVGVGDLNDDGTDDLIAQKTNGDLMLYRGTGSGTNLFAASQNRIGTSFRGSLLTSIGDLTGDGRTELLYRDAAGLVWRYDSKAGTLPIGTRSSYIGNASVGKAMKSFVGVGNLTTDAGLVPGPDTLWQVSNELLIVAPDMHLTSDDDVVIGSAWDPYKLF